MTGRVMTERPPSEQRLPKDDPVMRRATHRFARILTNDWAAAVAHVLPSVFTQVDDRVDVHDAIDARFLALIDDLVEMHPRTEHPRRREPLRAKGVVIHADDTLSWSAVGLDHGRRADDVLDATIIAINPNGCRLPDDFNTYAISVGLALSLTFGVTS